MSLEKRRSLVRSGSELSLQMQCVLLSIHRSGLYYSPVAESEENLHLMRLLDEQYFHTPFYGYRRLREWLLEQGYTVNKKRLSRLLNVMNWQTIYRKPSTTQRNKSHAVYPYLLKGLEINRANQVWAIDITYIPMRRGFLYLFAVLDVHTRFILNWGVSNSMSADWCCSIVEEAIQMHGQPEIINSDQGSQFTSEEYTNLLLKRTTPIQISMDGKGRAIDNIFIERFWKSIKYECIYLHIFEDGVELYEAIKKYMHFYNHKRLHQSLNYQTPAARYKYAA
jgi:putative transposase